MKDSKQFYKELTAEGLAKRKPKKYTKKELNYLKKNLTKRDQILDLACGYGRFTIPLAKEGYNIEGIYISPNLIKKAKRDKENLKIKFKIGDMRRLPYKNNSFDKIICMWSAFLELHKKQDQVKALKEMFRVLKIDGSALIEMPKATKLKYKIFKDEKSGDEIIFKDKISRGVLGGVEMRPMYNHNKKTLIELMEKIKMEKYKVFLDNFGGRERLFLQFWKEVKK
jgi:ubiquinone/menaquinone biosynthesis C-methylase UbiE